MVSLIGVQTVTTVLRRIAASSAVRFSDGFRLEQVDSCLRDLKTSVSPTLLSLKTSFLSPKPSTCLHATGIFLEPGLIATSARSVGRLTTSYAPRTSEKSDRFEHMTIRHKPNIGSTVALTAAGKILETKPLAVSFSGDVAVLEAVNPDGESFPHCALASSSPRTDDILVSIPHLGDSDSEAVGVFGRVMATGKRKFSEKPPWPVEDRAGWVEHDWLKYRGGEDPGFIWGKNATVDDSGRPWFNLSCEVVGIASWVAVDVEFGDPFGFTVPCSWIGTVLEYAKKKSTEDPIVMDRWVDAGME